MELIDAVKKREVGVVSILLAKYETENNDDEVMCPICETWFQDGGFHPASQKLYQHMGHGRIHRRTRSYMSWGDDDWNFDFLYFYP